MDQQRNLAIAVLTITATILLVAVILSFGGRSEALAIGQIDRGGDYILLTGQFTQNSELVYLTDAAARRLNVYSYEPTTRTLRLWDSKDLSRITDGKR